MDSINCKNKNKALTEEQKQKRSDYQKQYRKNMPEEQKQKLRDYQKNRYHNMYSEQKQKLIENNEKHNEIRNERRRFSNMNDEKKQ